MELVILAAGHGRRFGGLKQLAPIGPNGEAIMDYTASAAEARGYSGVVLVVRDEIIDEIRDHVRSHWPASLPVEFALQPPLPGTAQAVYAARDLVSGPFGVANADDLYGDAAIGDLLAHFDGPGPDDDMTVSPDEHVVVAYELFRTVLTDGPVTRGLLDVTADNHLHAIVEHVVELREDGSFDARPLPSNEPGSARVTTGPTRVLCGEERFSMNLWGFHPRIFDALEESLAAFDATTAARPKLLLPDIVGHLVSTGSDAVQVVDTLARCIGITHQDDLAILRDELNLKSIDQPTLRAARER